MFAQPGSGADASAWMYALHAKFDEPAHAYLL